MGAWDVGGFENDDALDWVWELEEARDTTILREVLAGIVDSDDYLESTDCCNALAAAEVVAALNRQPAPKLPDEVLAFISRVAAPPSPELLRLAAEAVEKIKTNSELRDVWDDSEKTERWLDEVESLLTRLT